MAAEATIRKIRQFLKMKRRQRGIEAGEISESLIDDRSRGSFWPGFEIEQENNQEVSGNISHVR